MIWPSPASASSVSHSVTITLLQAPGLFLSHVLLCLAPGPLHLLFSLSKTLLSRLSKWLDPCHPVGSWSNLPSSERLSLTTRLEAVSLTPCLFHSSGLS